MGAAGAIGTTAGLTGGGVSDMMITPKTEAARRRLRAYEDKYDDGLEANSFSVIVAQHTIDAHDIRLIHVELAVVH